MERIKTYREFWPLYLSEHRRAGNRVMHFSGTSLAILLLAAALWRHEPNLIPLAVVVGYGFAWVGHFAIEKNRPATLRYPLWSLISEFRLWALMLSGRKF